MVDNRKHKPLIGFGKMLFLWRKHKPFFFRFTLVKQNWISQNQSRLSPIQCRAVGKNFSYGSELYYYYRSGFGKTKLGSTSQSDSILGCSSQSGMSWKFGPLEISCTFSHLLWLVSSELFHPKGGSSEKFILGFGYKLQQNTHGPCAMMLKNDRLLALALKKVTRSRLQASASCLGFIKFSTQSILVICTFLKLLFYKDFILQSMVDRFIVCHIN